MAVLPRALAWQRTDVTGGEFVGYDDRRGLVARGVAFSATPASYGCRYDLRTDEQWVSTRFEVTAEGAGWLRTLRMERAAGRWRITAGEQGNLNDVAPSAPLPGTEEPDRLRDVLDIDLLDSPLTNTLPIRRLGLLGQPPGTERTIVAAWVLLPSLAVLPLEQTYTMLESGRIRYTSNNFTVELEVDEGGFVMRYPGLAGR
jgi:uncharacterized protein